MLTGMLLLTLVSAVDDAVSEGALGPHAFM
jgi:hypothetical protein